jgi:tRNA A37 threonylcarbamoyladenosine modification protein TsaB
MVALDARKESAYLYYDGEIHGAIKLEEIKNLLDEKEYYLITDDKIQQILGGVSYQQGEYPLGEILANLVYEKLRNSDAKWQELKPLYIQPAGVHIKG